MVSAERHTEKQRIAKRWREAAIAGDTAAIRRHLSDGRHIDALDKYGQTALMLAARHGHVDTLALLVEQGASLDVTAKYGLSALMLAVLNRHEDVARRLVAAGADLDIRGTGAPGFAGKTARGLAEDSGQLELAVDIALAGGH
jgi:ankyrin repeat protein